MTTAQVAELVARTRAEQGLPRHVEDPLFLNQLAASLVRRMQVKAGMVGIVAAGEPSADRPSAAPAGLPAAIPPSQSSRTAS
jgi:hypothetical protein